MSKAADTILPQTLARTAVEYYVTTGTITVIPPQLPDYLKRKSGAFVTIKTIRGDLRGCIGTIEAIYEMVAEEIIHNAIKAASNDYRFSPISAVELKELIYSVDIILPLEAIEDLNGHDVKIYGLLIETDYGQRGVLLPDIEGIDTAQDQLKALRRKIAIDTNTPVKMSRFTVERYGQK